MQIPKVNFYLKHVGAKEATLISLQLKFPIDQRVVLSTGDKIHPEQWDGVKQRALVNRKMPQNAETNLWLDKIDGSVKSIFRNLYIDGITPTAEIVKAKLLEVLSINPQLVTSKKVNLMGFIQDFMEQSKVNKALETIKSYKTTLNHITQFCTLNKCSLDFNDITIAFYHQFTGYLQEKGNSKNTISKQIKNVKTFMQEATERGLNSNMDFKSRSFKKVTEEVDKIYLTEEEIDRIYKLDLPPGKARVRDLFVIACYTGLRYSDFSEIKPGNILHDQIHMRTRKTGEKVIIPLAPIVREILTKYDFNLPAAVSNQKMNQYLKEIGEMAKINDPIIITRTMGGTKVRTTFMKFQLISAHCARRSMATNAYKRGVPTIGLMKITGHTTEKAFMSYIRISQMENAEVLAKHDFFN